MLRRFCPKTRIWRFQLSADSCDFGARSARVNALTCGSRPRRCRCEIPVVLHGVTRPEYPLLRDRRLRFFESLRYPLKTIDEQPTTLATHCGKVLLIVNGASKCGNTPRYKTLETVYQEKKDEGLVVHGKHRHPFHTALGGPDSPFPGNIGWNFEKFIVGRDRHILHRFAPNVPPDSPEVTAAINAALANQGAAR